MLRILVVEDSGVNQFIARSLLEKRGYAVVLANDGREALSILAAADFGGFSCVLMDVQMPVMDGFACTAAIREREKTSGHHLPIIAMTARSMMVDDACCLERGMDATVAKPLQGNELWGVIDRYLVAAPEPGL